MPELPDVEGFRRLVAEHAARREIERVDVRDAQVVRPVTARELARALEGRWFTEPRRMGKWLVLPTAAERNADAGMPSVLVHFGMTGKLVWCSTEDEVHPHDRVAFDVSGGELRYRDMRKLKGIRLVRSESDMEELLGGLGPDAWDVPREEYRRRVTSGRRKVKAALMDQGVIAGLGNLCVDETLWRARVHPLRTTTDLPDATLRKLYVSMRSVLRQSIRAERVPDRPSWLTGHRDEPDGVCPRCHHRLARGKVAGRTTSWCPQCQPR